MVNKCNRLKSFRQSVKRGWSEEYELLSTVNNLPNLLLSSSLSFSPSVLCCNEEHQLWGLRGMNSVSPSAAQYVGGAMQDELAESQRQQPLERQGSFGLRPPQTPDPSREATGEPDEMDKLKAKLMSAWNNVKYGLYWRKSVWVPVFVYIFYDVWQDLFHGQHVASVSLLQWLVCQLPFSLLLFL